MKISLRKRAQAVAGLPNALGSRNCQGRLSERAGVTRWSLDSHYLTAGREMQELFGYLHAEIAAYTV